MPRYRFYALCDWAHQRRVTDSQQSGVFDAAIELRTNSCGTERRQQGRKDVTTVWRRAINGIAQTAIKCFVIDRMTRSPSTTSDAARSCNTDHRPAMGFQRLFVVQTLL